MPSWLIDIGRWLSGFVVFGMCALFSGIALLPCWFAFIWIQDATSTMWAVASTPFLYGVWGWCYALLCVVYKRAIFYRPREGEWSLFSWAVVGWGTTGALTNFANITFLQHWKGTAMLNLYLRGMGCKIGHRVSINTVLIFDWDLIEIDDDAVLGGDCVVQGHLLEKGGMKMRPVRIGKRVLVGTGAKVMPGCVLDDGSVLAAGSIMKKGFTIPANEVWGGTPPKLLRARGEAEIEKAA
jgi:non-ribosomal peptide synthetase-like protein